MAKNRPEKQKSEKVLRVPIPFVIYIALLVSGSVLSGCTKWLDLKPESEIIAEEFWQTESQAQSVMFGCYKSLTSDAMMSRFILWGEGRSDNVEALDTNDDALKRLVRFSISPTNGYCSWGSFYTVINYCNTFLYNAPQVLKNDQNFTQAKLNTMMGEVLAIRSLVYFYLVRVYKNVPWINTPSVDDQQDYQITQSSEREVLDSIIGNLNQALRLAPTAYKTTAENKGRITKDAIRAILADVYLWDQQYEKSVEKCDEIISASGLELLDSESMFYNVFYNGNSDETIFELQFGDPEKDNRQFNNMVRDYYGSSKDAIVALSFSEFLYATTASPFRYKVGTTMESAIDNRLKDFVFPMAGSGMYLIFKYAGVNRTEATSGTSTYSTYYYRNNSANWIMYRLADIMLMKAEALIQLNRSEDDLHNALSLVNQTYLRSNTEEIVDSLQFDNYSTRAQLEELVLRERQRELLFEGKRWFDLVRLARRNGSVGPLLTYIGPKMDASEGEQVDPNASLDALYLPVFQGDIDANPKLVQNPYYEALQVNSK